MSHNSFSYHLQVGTDHRNHAGLSLNLLCTGGFCSVTWNLPSHWLASGSCVSQRSPGHDSPPACNTFFRYLGSGKIFLHDAEDVGRRSRTNPAHRRIEYFWLCGKCCSAMHLMRVTDG